MITDNELTALQVYLHKLAEDWWDLQPESKAFATCDSCGYRTIEHNNGYLIGSYLWCITCFEGKAVGQIKKDGADNMLGYGVLAKAIEMTRRRRQEFKEQDEIKKRKAEELRHLSTQEKRKSQKQCVMCGKPLGFFNKLFGNDKHSSCSLFVE